MVDRNIPAHKLDLWLHSATSPAQRKARMRWIIAYCHGASYQTMTAMAACPTTPAVAEEQITTNFDRRRLHGTH
jgi:hypothetical protein